ncbi:MAG: response regulator [Abyssibacter sp.]|uniref:response regulator n=1 Tax=Abyssibacter sp. TaxID=2320200 RepID=UPI00321B8A7B
MAQAQILLVEDNPADVRLTQEILSETALDFDLTVARDGEQAMGMLRREGAYADTPVPDLVLLDLNLPRKDGREVLAEVKKDPVLRSIPVLVLSTSKAENDIRTCYDLHANCYLTKPVDLNQFADMVQTLERFWFNLVLLPPKEPDLLGAG